MWAEKLRRRKGKKKNNCLHITKEGGRGREEGKQLMEQISLSHNSSLITAPSSYLPLLLSGTKCCCSVLVVLSTFAVFNRVMFFRSASGNMLDRIWEWHQLALLPGRLFCFCFFLFLPGFTLIFGLLYSNITTVVAQLNQHVGPSLPPPHCGRLCYVSEEVSVVVDVAMVQKWETFPSKYCSLRSLGFSCVLHGNSIRNAHRWINMLLLKDLVLDKCLTDWRMWMRTDT